uniref:Putative secreted protein n=1 Tax=Anopheles darlingi TaxID=43151 RepID=A0A2M4DD95_ANODA
MFLAVSYVQITICSLRLLVFGVSRAVLSLQAESVGSSGGRAGYSAALLVSRTNWCPLRNNRSPDRVKRDLT